MKLIINSDALLSKAIGDLRSLYAEHKYVRLILSTGKDRSLDQSAHSHTWYKQISEELREDTPAGVKAECKLRYGVAIMRRDDEDFKAMYDAIIKPHPYEKKLKMMAWLPLTSLMTTKQLKEYLEEVQAGYKGRVQLEFPPDEK